MKLSLPDNRYRRLTGVALGGALGLVYGLVSQFINQVAMPGVPLYQPPFGPTGNIVMAVAGGALLGGTCAWPLNGVGGTFLASAVSAGVVVVGSFISAGISGTVLGAAVLTGAFLALPFWAMLVPMLAVLRWGVNIHEEAHRDGLPFRRRLPSTTVLVVAVGIIGAMSLIRSDGRYLLSRTNLMLQEARAGAVPPPLAAAAVGPFQPRGLAPYNLSWERRDIEKYRIPRPGRNFNNHSVVAVRFENGWHIACLYITAEEAPVCKGFDQLPP